MEQVIIGVDPHKLSATIEVVDVHEKLLGSGRFTTDQRRLCRDANHAKTWPDRVWAVEGANGVGRPLAQRRLEAGEEVVDVPANRHGGSSSAQFAGDGGTDAGAAAGDEPDQSCRPTRLRTRVRTDFTLGLTQPVPSLTPGSAIPART